MSVKKRWRRAWAPCSMTACSVRFLKVINQGLESARELVVRRVDQKFGCTSLRFTPQILSRCMQCATVVTGVTRVTRRISPLTSEGTTRHAQANTGKCRGRWSSWVVLATTSLLTLLNFSFRLVSLDSHLLYFFFQREQEKRECAEARNEKDDHKLSFFSKNCSVSKASRRVLSEVFLYLGTMIPGPPNLWFGYWRSKSSECKRWRWVL